jgi:hypothetical protein
MGASLLRMTCSKLFSKEAGTQNKTAAPRTIITSFLDSGYGRLEHEYLTESGAAVTNRRMPNIKPHPVAQYPFFSIL